MAMEFRERMRALGRMALIVFILGAAAFLSAITAIRFAIQGREVEVPGVVGLKAGDAQAKLTESRLAFRIADRVFNELPVDHVVRQSPPPGTRVKARQRAHVVLSLGPRKLPIPSLEGKSLRVARIELLRSGLQLGAVSGVHLPESGPETVVRQSPRPGDTGSGSPRVNMLVALGEPPVFHVMPDLAGLPLSEAQRQITGTGLRLASLRILPVPGTQRNTVLQQTPPRGARVSPGTGVELQVAE
jgi:beta-lactam-binding protein with PASTA domain